MLTQLDKENHKILMHFLNIMLDHGLKVVYAGGCARDILQGNAPNDYDMWVLGDDSIHAVFNAVESSLKQIRTTYGVPVALHTVQEDSYNGAPERRDLEYVLQMIIGDVECDVIKMHRNAGEEVGILDVLQGFDFPMNQFAFTIDSNVIGIGHLYTEQHATRELRQERIDHMAKKFPEHTFYNVH